MLIAVDSTSLNTTAYMRTRKRLLSSSGRNISTCSSCPNSTSKPAPPVINESLTWLEQLRLQVSIENASAPRDHVEYVLEVAHIPTRAHWHVKYTLAEYRAFQQHLLRALQHGHFCHAECPWLYSFLKSYFPKPSFLQLSKSRTLEANRNNLMRCLTTLQSFLTNRSNHCCAVLTDTIAEIVLVFVNGARGARYQAEYQAEKAQSGAPTSNPGANGKHSFSSRLSWSSQATTTLDDTEDASGNQDTCGICGNKLDNASEFETEIETENDIDSEKPRTDSNNTEVSSSSPSQVESISSPSFDGRRRQSTHASASASQRSRVYVMTLACGHQFHDECIVPKLNESMTCPTCGHPEA